jgi:hypothetical protein
LGFPFCQLAPAFLGAPLGAFSATATEAANITSMAA